MKITLTLTPEQVELFLKKSLVAGEYTHRQNMAANLVIEALEGAKNAKGGNKGN